MDNPWQVKQPADKELEMANNALLGFDEGMREIESIRVGNVVVWHSVKAALLGVDQRITESNDHIQGCNRITFDNFDQAKFAAYAILRLTGD